MAFIGLNKNKISITIKNERCHHVTTSYVSVKQHKQAYKYLKSQAMILTLLIIYYPSNDIYVTNIIFLSKQ